MKKLMAIVLSVAMLAMGAGVGVVGGGAGVALASPSITVYDNDQAGWEAAVGCWEVEDFTDEILNPGVSVVSDLGEILVPPVAPGLWWDQLDYDGGPTTFTTWTFANPIYAFGGTWDAGSDREYDGHPVGGPGSNIEVLIDGSWVSVGVIDNDYIDVFWGFVSDVPFTQVRLQAYNDEGWTERYTLDNMVYSDITPPVVWSGETANPHGQNTPPAGWTTLPGAKGGMNEDGFYVLYAVDNCDPHPMIYVTDRDMNYVFGPFPSETVVKFTEDPTVPPECKKMGSDKGKAGYVSWHIILPTDPIVWAVDASGNVAWEIQLVPPAPK